MAFSLEKFESYAYGRDIESGMHELNGLLEALDANYGLVGPQFLAPPLLAINQANIDQHIYTRIAAAISCLLSDKSLFIAPEWQQRILTLHRWLAAIFAASPFCNADHVMRALNMNEDKSDLGHFELARENILKFCLLYTPDSEVSLDLDALWEADKALAAGLCLVLISPRFLGSPLAHGKREKILPWLAERLGKIEDIEQLPVGILHDLYMHCSYANRKDKHDIKRPINYLIRRKLAAEGVFDTKFTVCPQAWRSNKKPVMLVVLEWFTSSHSIYRTHSRTIESARRHFHVVGMAYSHCVDEITKNIFDEFIKINDGSMIEQLRQIQNKAKDINASVCYMPSVGMFSLTMWLANLRIAPLQLMALGHPATTHGHAMDYVVVEEDYVGSDSCFSEKLLKLPKDGMPYRPAEAAKNLPISRAWNRKPNVVQIAVCATTMKLNPGFLEACAQIEKKSSAPVQFRFLVGQAQGLTYPNVQRVIHMFLGDSAIVYPHQSYADYMKVILECDMFINPFPFGNTNGIIDTVSAGLVGICMTGDEVHEHIDQGLFERLGFPKWLVAKNVGDYVSAAVRLIENYDERVLMSKKFSGNKKLEVMFKGRPEIFGDILLHKVKKLGFDADEHCPSSDKK